MTDLWRGMPLLLLAGAALLPGCRGQDAVRRPSGVPPVQSPAAAPPGPKIWDLKVSALTQYPNGAGIGVADPAATGLDRETRLLTRGMGRWLRVQTAAQPDLHKTPFVADLEIALGDLDRAGRPHTFEAVGGPFSRFGVTHAAVGEASPAEIDNINIHKASLQAMRRAVMALAPLPDVVLVDAFRIPDLLVAQRGVVHGDQRCSAIAAASIVAKVTRDRQMRELHTRDPRYGVDRHKGYATADHLAAVRQCGYSAVHRRSFSPPALPLEFDTID